MKRRSKRSKRPHDYEHHQGHTVEHMLRRTTWYMCELQNLRRKIKSRDHRKCSMIEKHDQGWHEDFQKRRASGCGNYNSQIISGSTGVYKYLKAAPKEAKRHAQNQEFHIYFHSKPFWKPPKRVKLSKSRLAIPKVAKKCRGAPKKRS